MASGFSRELPAGTLSQAQKKPFIPLDAALSFSDFQYLLPWRAADFEKLFPILEQDAFQEINDTTALSNHEISWGLLIEL